MTITGQLRLGTTFTVNVGEATGTQMALSPNQSPNGATIEVEMGEYISMFLSLMELAFATPEPIRRNLVGILRDSIGRTARELHDAAEVARTFAQRVAAKN